MLGMFAKDHPEFDSQCPERFDWYRCTQGTIGEIASVISARVYLAMREPEQQLVNGLRESLRIIARHADVGPRRT